MLSNDMKRLIFVGAGILAFAAQLAYGQGSILFQNLWPGGSAQVRDYSGALISAGTSWTVELLAGSSAGSVAPFATPITTTAWVGAGFFGVGQPERVLPGFAPGNLPFLQVRLWDNAGGTITSYAAAIAAGSQYGSSAVWQLPGPPTTGGLGNPGASPPVPGPALVGMTGLALIPEPSTIALGILGAAALLFRRRK
jgi:hypothetical protein